MARGQFTKQSGLIIDSVGARRCYVFISIAFFLFCLYIANMHIALTSKQEAWPIVCTITKRFLFYVLNTEALKLNSLFIYSIENLIISDNV